VPTATSKMTGEENITDDFDVEAATPLEEPLADANQSRYRVSISTTGTTSSRNGDDDERY